MASINGGELDRAERLCLAAERGLVRERRQLQTALAAPELQPIANETVG
jgi:hypothetical protein